MYTRPMSSPMLACSGCSGGSPCCGCAIFALAPSLAGCAHPTLWRSSICRFSDCTPVHHCIHTTYSAHTSPTVSRISARIITTDRMTLRLPPTSGRRSIRPSCRADALPRLPPCFMWPPRGHAYPCSGSLCEVCSCMKSLYCIGFQFVAEVVCPPFADSFEPPDSNAFAYLSGLSTSGVRWNVSERFTSTS